MAFATLNDSSRSLGKASSFHVVFPDDPAIPRPWAVFDLLHGLSDDHTTWMRRTSIERYVEGLPLAVVMPDGGRGWYTNAVDGQRLRGRPGPGRRRPGRPHLPRRGGARRPGDRRAVDGRLRRGQGRPEAPRAVRQHHLALRRPRLRAGRGRGVAAALPRVRPDLRQGPRRRAGRPVRPRRGARPRPDPPLRIDRGSDDFLLGQNRAFHAHLDAMRVPHEYEESPGGHTRASWDFHVRQAIDSHAKNFQLARRP